MTHPRQPPASLLPATPSTTFGSCINSTSLSANCILLHLLSTVQEFCQGVAAPSPSVNLGRACRVFGSSTSPGSRTHSIRLDFYSRVFSSGLIDEFIAIPCYPPLSHFRIVLNQVFEGLFYPSYRLLYTSRIQFTILRSVISRLFAFISIRPLPYIPFCHSLRHSLSGFRLAFVTRRSI